MKLFIVFFFYGVITSKNVSCLNCYATDPSQLASGKLHASLQDCRSNLEELFKSQHMQVPSANDLELQELRCFKVEAFADSGSTVIKGCTPEGGCEVMKVLFKIALSSQRANSYKQVTSIDCYECNGNSCNGSKSIIMYEFRLIALALLTFYFSGK